MEGIGIAAVRVRPAVTVAVALADAAMTVALAGNVADRAVAEVAPDRAEAGRDLNNGVNDLARGRAGVAGRTFVEVAQASAAKRPHRCRILRSACVPTTRASNRWRVRSR